MKTKCCHSRFILEVERQKVCVNPKCKNYLRTTPVYREMRMLRRSLALSMFTFSMLFSFDDMSKTSREMDAEILMSCDEQMPSLNLENVAEELHRLNVVCPEHVLAQIRIESGNLNSFLSQRTNNLMGMRYPFKRATTAYGIYLADKDTILQGNSTSLKKYAKLNHYAAYKTWQDALADYKLWQDQNFKLQERYLDFLGKIYAEDSLYTTKVKSISMK